MSGPIKVQIRASDHADHKVLRVMFDFDTAADWYAHLSLLKQGEVDSVTLSEKHKRPFQFHIKLSPIPVNRGLVYWQADEAVLSIDPVELDYWLAFFAKYRSEGVGDVDHIDIEIPASQATGGSGLFLILGILEARPPVTEDSARGRLGLRPPSRRES